MRILVVADFFPWPSTGGGLMRLSRSIEALSELGDLDLFSFFDARQAERIVPPNVRIARLGVTPYPRVAPPLRWRAGWLVKAGTPMEVTMRGFDTTPRVAFQSWAADHYDLAWFNMVSTYEWLGRPALGPTIIDIVDLESEKEKERVHILRGAPPAGGPLGSVRDRIAMTQGWLNARDWNALQKSVSAGVDRVLLCSQLDVARSGIRNAEIVANSYPRPVRPAGHLEVGRPPIVLFQGSLNYGPNVDAVSWFVHDLAPRIRSLIPDLQIRLVGTPSPRVEGLHDPPAVTVVGRIPEMEPELARADLAVVPVRYGSGTRLKILESFAHRIPVVSTTLGFEGLDVEPGVHLLVADDPDDFAEACQRLLVDQGLRAQIVDAAERRYLEEYDADQVKQHIQGLARSVAATDGRL